MTHTSVLTHDSLLLDGQPIQLFCGALHYFRILPEQWRDRLEKMVAMGLNSVEMYVYWELHEPTPGQYDFSGRADIEQFLTIAQELELKVVFRPGPYICAEIDNGGVPVWMLPQAAGKFRRNDPSWMTPVKRWMAVLLKRLERFQWTHGGPIVMAAVENEYGSFGRDKAYLAELKQCYLDAGWDIPLFTADGGGENNFLIHGMLPGTPVALTLGESHTAECFKNQDALVPNLPHFCVEYWLGWFSHWKESEPKTDHSKSLRGVETLWEQHPLGVNLYMFHGGTNFGFSSGANAGFEGGNDYAATVTSYDYRAPLTEWGDPAPTFKRYQEIYKKFNPDARCREVAPAPKLAAREVPFTCWSPLIENVSALTSPLHMEDCAPMESWGQKHGLVLYECKLYGPAGNEGPLQLTVSGMHDRAQLWLDGKYLGVLWRNEPLKTFPFTLSAGEHQLQILVEDCGHVNYGPQVGLDFKGITRGVAVNVSWQRDFTVWPLPLESLDNIPWQTAAPGTTGPLFAQGEFELPEGEAPADCFLKFPGVKGIVWINGFNLGRYWNVGPGDRLYLPWPLLRTGKNTITVLELEELSSQSAQLTPEPPRQNY